MGSASDASALTDDWQRLLVDWSQKIGVSLLILFVFWVLAAMARKVVRKAGATAGIDSSVINLTGALSARRADSGRPGHGAGHAWA